MQPVLRVLIPCYDGLGIRGSVRWVLEKGRKVCVLENTLILYVLTYTDDDRNVRRTVASGRPATTDETERLGQIHVVVHF